MGELEGFNMRWRPRGINLGGESLIIEEIEVSDGAPQEVKEGLARRAIVSAGGRCPCGAKLRLPPRAARRRAARLGLDIEVTIDHRHDCPALLRGWAMVDMGPEPAA